MRPKKPALRTKLCCGSQSECFLLQRSQELMEQQQPLILSTQRGTAILYWNKTENNAHWRLFAPNVHQQHSLKQPWTKIWDLPMTSCYLRMWGHYYLTLIEYKAVHFGNACWIIDFSAKISSFLPAVYQDSSCLSSTLFGTWGNRRLLSSILLTILIRAMINRIKQSVDY